MASINRLRRELLFKVVFYGPGLGGKTTTLQHVHAATKPENRGNMLSLATDTDRTLYFDYLPVRLLKVGDVTVKLQLYTVPGQTARPRRGAIHGVPRRGPSRAGKTRPQHPRGAPVLRIRDRGACDGRPGFEGMLT